MSSQHQNTESVSDFILVPRQELMQLQSNINAAIRKSPSRRLGRVLQKVASWLQGGQNHGQ